MLDFIAYTTAQQRTFEEARAALPDSPVRDDGRRAPLRRRASVMLRRIADRLEPPPSSIAPAGADCR